MIQVTLMFIFVSQIYKIYSLTTIGLRNTAMQQNSVLSPGFSEWRDKVHDQNLKDML